jgi:4-amino-4-deoxy-L-arabinose transferase-like glycosyltransferase
VTATLTARSTGDTVDEGTYRRAGEIYLTTHHFAENHDHPPLAKWLGALYPHYSGANTLADYRYAHIAIYALGGLLIALFLASATGATAGALFASMYFLDPNLKAMASLDVTDADVAVWLGGASVLLWGVWRSQRPRRDGYWMFFLQGLAAGTKITALLYLPFALFAAVRKRLGAWGCASGFLMALLIAYHLNLRELEWLAASIGFQFKHNQAGQMSLFFGSYPPHGTPLFFAALYFLKLPLPLIALTLAGVGLAVREWREFRGEWESFFLPAALIGLALSLAHVQLGFRYFLPALVLIEIGASLVIAMRAHSRVSQGAVLALCVCLLGMDAWTLKSDSYLAYFNVLERAPTRDFCDSNNDWGQGVPPWLRPPGALDAETLTAKQIAAVPEGKPVEILAGASLLCASSRPEGSKLREYKPVRVFAGHELYELSREDALGMLAKLTRAR